MGKPKQMFFVQTRRAPQWGYGHAGKHVYSRKGHALNLAERVRKTGGEATVFVADCEWRPYDG